MNKIETKKVKIQKINRKNIWFVEDKIDVFNIFVINKIAIEPD